LRVGYSISHAEIADLLNRVRQPFNVNSLALAAAEAALQDQGHLQNALACNVAGLQQYARAFTTLGLEYIPSIANFISVKVGEAATIYEQLLRQGVIVRPVANYGMPEYLRITVGTAEENQRCIDALQQVMSL